jgi:iron complex outermembrane recepter protein
MDEGHPYIVLTSEIPSRLTPGVKPSGLAENPAKAKYETCGTVSPTAPVLTVQASGATITRSISPAAPVAGHGGVHATV